jgi:hypothetical protein
MRQFRQKWPETERAISRVAAHKPGNEPLSVSIFEILRPNVRSMTRSRNLPVYGDGSNVSDWL